MGPKDETFVQADHLCKLGYPPESQRLLQFGTLVIAHLVRANIACGALVTQLAII